MQFHLSYEYFKNIIKTNIWKHDWKIINFLKAVTFKERNFAVLIFSNFVKFHNFRRNFLLEVCLRKLMPAKQFLKHTCENQLNRHLNSNLWSAFSVWKVKRNPTKFKWKKYLQNFWSPYHECLISFLNYVFSSRVVTGDSFYYWLQPCKQDNKPINKTEIQNGSMKQEVHY